MWETEVNLLHSDANIQTSQISRASFRKSGNRKIQAAQPLGGISHFSSGNYWYY
jgi:hypothetical protein